MNETTKEYLDEMLPQIRAFRPFDNGRVKTEYRGGGSYDVYTIYCENRLLARLTTKDGNRIWTAEIDHEGGYESLLGNALIPAMKGMLAAWPKQ